MNRYATVTATAFIVVLIGVFVVNFRSDDTQTSSAASQQQAIEERVARLQPGQEYTTEISPDKGSYQEYTDLAVGANPGDSTVIFFNAAWCPTCQIAKKNFSENANNIPQGLHILDADFDDLEELRKSYGVTIQHTFVQVDSDGSLIKKWNGSFVIDQVIGQLQS